MSAETDVFATLSTSSGITALVGERIYPDVAPETSVGEITHPFIAYARSSSVPTYTINGTLVATEVDMSINCYAGTRALAEQVADLVVAAMAPDHYFSARSTDFNAEVSLHVAVLDFTMWELATTGAVTPAPALPDNSATFLSDDFESGIQFTVAQWHRYNIQGGIDEFSPDPANAVTISTDVAHSGTHSLKCVTGQDLLYAQKAGLARELLVFQQGGDFWYSAWYYIPAGPTIENLYIFELETTVGAYVGRRLAFDGSSALWIQAKLGCGADFFQAVPVPFPRNQWVHVKLHFHLSTGNDGTAQLWQDDVLLISATGRNLPDGHFYDWIVVGQSNNMTHQMQTLYVDDVLVSDVPI